VVVVVIVIVVVVVLVLVAVNMYRDCHKTKRYLAQCSTLFEI